MDNSALVQQLTVLEVGKALGVSPATVWRWAKAGRIPQPRKLGANSTRWDSREVQAAIQKMAA
jgi:excisionase family DNA binding protein